MNNLITSVEWQDAVEIASPSHNGAPKGSKPFVEANTDEASLAHLKNDCIIPVFSKDNERTISHQEFVESVQKVVDEVFGLNQASEPEIRVSHPIKGRTPEAIHKSAKELLECEKTIYYERMAFAIEIPTVTDVIAGSELTLTVGGVRSYNHENLYSRKSIEHFKVFIGFKNMVCCNMCVSSDGYVEALKASTTEELMGKMLDLVRKYESEEHLKKMNQLTALFLTESQFAQVLGKCRLHNYLPKQEKGTVPLLEFTDTQIHSVAKDYFTDDNFARDGNGNVNLWRMYNLLTGANKNSYIDQFLNRSVNAFDLVTGLAEALEDSSSPYNWFLK